MQEECKECSVFLLCVCVCVSMHRGMVTGSAQLLLDLALCMVTWVESQSQPMFAPFLTWSNYSPNIVKQFSSYFTFLDV